MLSVMFLFKSFYLRLCPRKYFMSLPDIKIFVRRGDEVERSLELLDRVLSEFDDLENGNVGLEDDGYMSMNGRRQFKQEFPHRQLRRHNVSYPPYYPGGFGFIAKFGFHTDCTTIERFY